MRELPTGWASATLGDVADWGSGGTPKAGTPEYYNGDIPWAVIGDLTDGPVKSTARMVSESGLANSSAKVVGSDVVLVAMYGSIGKLGLPTAPMATNQAIAFARPCVGLVSRLYLFYYLMHARSALASAGKGATQQNISQTILKGWPISVAPPAEQTRIVAAIEEQFSRLEAGVGALRAARENIAVLRAAVLRAACSGELVPHARSDVARLLCQVASDRRATWEARSEKPYKEPVAPDPFPLSIPSHWRVASLEALTDPVRVICYGILMPKEHVEDGVPYVRVKDMKGWSIDMPNLRRTSREIAAQYARASLKAGDLLLAIRGSYGRVAIVPDALDGANITQDSARVASHPGIDHRYLLYYLGGSVANSYYQRVARGVAVKGVNIGDLRRMPVPVPPPEEQAAIAVEVERQLSLLDRSDAAVAAQLARAESLRAAVLAAAFSGRLTRQDQDDESASAVLDRISAGRRATSRPRRRRATA